MEKTSDKKTLEELTEDWNREHKPEIACGMISHHRQQGKNENAWQLLYEAMELFPENREINNEHAWLLYDFELTPAKSRKNFDQIIETANKIINLEPDLLLQTICVFAATDACKAINEHEKTLQFLALLDKSRLEKSPREYAGKRIMSWRERWYFACINALFETGNFIECREICLEATADFPQILEFKRKAALCLAESGELAKAAEELQRLILSRNVPWYVNSDLAKILFETGNVEEAWRQTSKAAQAKGELKTKVNLFQLMARILLAQGKRQAAASHLCLAAKVREEQNWSIPESLSEMLQKLNTSHEQTDLKTLLSCCRPFWTGSNCEIKPEVADKIDKKKVYRGVLLMKNPASHFAFIKCRELTENIYVKASDIPETLKIDGKEVRFSITTSFDAKKSRESKRAVNIAG
ncbi:MAG: hypothetical protein PWR01_4605 [Clostridiales bacterium]|nr:hypothetical protein [Clostridiales bacterium]MDN5283532.1 hypothetical protein [Candidatus Ozemobacter sp.]